MSKLRIADTLPDDLDLAARASEKDDARFKMPSIRNILHGRKEGKDRAPLTYRRIEERWSRDNRFKKHSYVEIIIVMVVLITLIEIVLSVI